MAYQARETLQIRYLPRQIQRSLTSMWHQRLRLFRLRNQGLQTSRSQHPDITETPQISATPEPAPQVTTPAQTVTPKPEKTPTATPVSEEKEPTNTPAPGQGGSSYRGGGYGGSSGGSSAGTSSPKTGDTSDMALWQCLLLMAIAAILATGWKLQKRKINK